ncbi:MAG: hypothetical protein PHF29_08365 [Candidatus Riflebacteria bacterium]|nr:hypothetical protein [Candidatus Riflebacteria bacterium]
MGLSGFNKARREAGETGVAIGHATEMEISIEELTKAEIINQLEEKGIKFDARKSKESLIELLKAGE